MQQLPSRHLTWILISTLSAWTHGLADGEPSLDAEFTIKFDAAKRTYLQQRQDDLGTSPNSTDGHSAGVEKLSAHELIDEATAEANRWIDKALAVTSPNETLSMCIDSINKHRSGTTHYEAIWECAEWLYKNQPVTTPREASSECAEELLQKHFKAITTADMTVANYWVHNQLPLIKTHRYGINSNDVTYTYGGFFCLDDKPAYTAKSGTSNTHLCDYLFKEYVFPDYPSDVDALAHTLIHESLHRVPPAQKRLLGWPFERYEAWSEKYARMSFEESLRNPDSYASFIRDAHRCPDTP
ncbi:MAG: hypothetical protein V3W33_05375 [Gammaproteobacteria bacterium]|jgi:hypothetical protein